MSSSSIGLLVVSASHMEFEGGLVRNAGGTFLSAILAFTLGIKEIIVAVTKMDDVKWSKERFDEIVAELSQKLTHIGYRVPIHLAQ